MAKFNIGLNGQDVGVAEAREAWAGELPPTGSYSGVLKVLSLGKIGPDAKNAGKDKMQIGVELRCDGEKGNPLKKYDGYIAWGNLNLIEGSEAYINQFLLALTDESDEAFEKIKSAFYGSGPSVDERKKHILKIGAFNINSPEGELPIKVSLKNTPYTNPKTNVTTQSVQINSYLLGGGSAPTGSAGAPETAIEEESSVELEPEDNETDVEPDVENVSDEEPEVEVEEDDESLLDA